MACFFSYLNDFWRLEIIRKSDIFANKQENESARFGIMLVYGIAQTLSATTALIFAFFVLRKHLDLTWALQAMGSPTASASTGDSVESASETDAPNIDQLRV
jgi:hypothetical protein